MLDTEKALDMLPFVADIYEKLDVASYYANSRAKAEKNADKDTSDTIKGFEVIAFILKKSPKIKEEIFNLVAIAEEKSVEVVKKQPFVSTLKTFKEIFADKELVSFFKEAMQ